ncbi:MAG: glycerol-3-phosphate dehydrogenase C-terminal domain-containing protein [Cyanobacteriota bacterium]|nr:glycerol-3-phosphate dehydrogenase C-terminal domain-containing protein [Cyanobacteriota bacterium]
MLYLLPSTFYLLPSFFCYKAEIIHAIHQEMADKLSDVIFQLTELGSPRYPGNETIKLCAEVMNKELGWSLTK